MQNKRELHNRYIGCENGNLNGYNIRKFYETSHCTNSDKKYDTTDNTISKTFYEDNINNLENYNIDCKNNPIKQFNIIDESDGTLSYNYTCSRLELTDIEKKKTREFDKKYGIYNFDIDCGSNKLLSQFKLNTKLENGQPTNNIYYEYTCGKDPSKDDVFDFIKEYFLNHDWDNLLKKLLIETHIKSKRVEYIFDHYALRPLWWALCLFIYEKTVEIFKNNNMYHTLVADGGIFLSTMRYEGIMPWDDDLDIGIFMEREEYNQKILSIISDFLKCEYLYVTQHTMIDYKKAPPYKQTIVNNISEVNIDNLVYFHVNLNDKLYLSILEKLKVDVNKEPKYSSTLASLKYPWSDFFIYINEGDGQYKSIYDNGFYNYNREIVFPTLEKKFFNFNINMPASYLKFFAVMYPGDDYKIIKVRPQHHHSSDKKPVVINPEENEMEELERVVRVYNNLILQLYPLTRKYLYQQINKKKKYMKYKKKYLEIKNNWTKK